MKQHKTLGWIVIGVMVAALAIGVVPAFAQTATPPATSTAPQARGGFGGRGGMMCGQAGLDAAAKALKLTTTELQAQLWGGQTLSGLADKAGVEVGRCPDRRAGGLPAGADRRDQSSRDRRQDHASQRRLVDRRHREGLHRRR